MLIFLVAAVITLFLISIVRKYWKHLLLIVSFLLLYVSACGHNQISPISPIVSSPVNIRPIKHVMGETKISLHPQRIVVLDAYVLDPVLSLGVKPVGAPRMYLEQIHVKDKTVGIKDVSWSPNNLEKILALKPDLILGSSIFHKNIYPLLSDIAPTVLVKLETSGDWKEIFTFIANTLDKKQVASQVMANYNRRLTQFKTRMGKQLSETKVSILRVATDSVSVFTKGAFSSTILKDAGLPRPPLQNLDIEATRRKGGNPIAYPISKELLDWVEGDIVFVTKVDIGIGDVQQALRQLKAEPLWTKLKVVQRHRVHEVPYYWLGTGPLAANRVIDDLFRYLLPGDEVIAEHTLAYLPLDH